MIEFGKKLSILQLSSFGQVWSKLWQILCTIGKICIVVNGVGEILRNSVTLPVCSLIQSYLGITEFTRWLFQFFAKTVAKIQRNRAVVFLQQNVFTIFDISVDFVVTLLRLLFLLFYFLRNCSRQRYEKAFGLLSIRYMELFRRSRWATSKRVSNVAPHVIHNYLCSLLTQQLTT